MKTVVIGAVAMGSLFGGLLALKGEEVWLFDIWKEHIEAIRTQGLVIEERDKIQNIPVRATADLTAIGKADLVLYFVKTYHTEQAVKDSLVLEKEDTLFLTLQNGLGNEEVLCRFVDRKKVILGVTGQGATLIGPGRIRHAGWGKTYVGELDGTITERVIRIARTFQKAGIETEVSPRIHDLVWEKLFVNAGLNALAAITGLKNGQILDHPESLRILEALVSEAVEVARRKGIRIEGNPLERVKAVLEATRENRCSMGQDLDRKRRTEIDAINGALVREAERLGLSVPYNRMITDLIKVIEKQF
ncbi:MAG: 2-dehydropantoate 2-reductase [Desulfobacterota bacterium]|nr:2-dehydropantoate 2-reductase [Thermodesulfobacteriota bacterium]